MTPVAPATLSVGTLNVWGRWADWPRRLEALRGCWPAPAPEVLLLQEVRVDDRGDQAAEIADALGYSSSVSVEGHRADDGSEGLAILSTRALHDPHHEDLQPSSDPPRRVLLAHVEIGDTRVPVMCGHTVAKPEEVRTEQVRALVARRDEPLVLGADLNDTPQGVAPLLAASGLRDALAGDGAPTWPMCHITFGEAWKSQIGRAPHFSLERRRLDYLLSRGLDVLDAGVEPLRGPDGTYASDHALVWARYTGPDGAPA